MPTTQRTIELQRRGFEYDVAGNQTRALAADGVTWRRYEYDAANRLHIVKEDNGTTFVQAFQFGSTNARLMDTDYQTGFTRMFASVGGTVLAEYHENYATPLAWIKSYVYLGNSQSQRYKTTAEAVNIPNTIIPTGWERASLRIKRLEGPTNKPIFHSARL